MKRITLSISAIGVFMLLSVLCCCGKPAPEQTPIGKVLLLGNSIVKHDPAPSIGWHGDWGMAASCRDSDYVHVVAKRIAKISPKTEVAWGNLAAFERDYATYDLTQLQEYRGADVLVIKISENLQNTPDMEAQFRASYDALVNYLKGENTRVVICEGFWPSPVNAMIKRYATSKGYTFIALSDLFANDKTNAAIGLFANEGVANHPSDKGMRNIASRILSVIIPNYFK